MMNILLGSVSMAAIISATGGGGGDLRWEVKVAAGTVGSDLTGFPLFIRLDDLFFDFWLQLDSIGDVSGETIRVYAADGVTQLPFDVTYLDKANRIGSMYVKTDIAAASETAIIIKLDGATAISPTDPYGRNAVWSGYSVVQVFPERVNRVDGSAPQRDLTGPGSAGIREDWAFVNTDRMAYRIPDESVFTMGVSSAFDSAEPREQGLVSVAKVSDPTKVLAYLMDEDSPDKLDVFSSYDGWLGASPVALSPDTGFRGAMRQNGTSDRDLWVNGSVVGSAAPVTAQVDDSANGGEMDFTVAGYRIDTTFRDAANQSVQFAWLRPEILGDDWLAADAANNGDPLSFYTATQFGGAVDNAFAWEATVYAVAGSISGPEIAAHENNTYVVEQ